jgi:peptidoglycan/LPS O-acetylase OafA/YrhL
LYERQVAGFMPSSQGSRETNMMNLKTVVQKLSDLPNTVGRPLSRAYIPELDGLRFIALIFVMIWHASVRASRYNAEVAGNAGGDGYYWHMPHGEIGVLLFFFISGYVVSQPFLGRPSSEWNIRSFYVRRFIRIYPPYLIALSLCLFALMVIGYVPADASSYQVSDIPLTSSYLASLFYVHSFLFDAPSRLNPPIWSLELEIVFYILAPLILYFYTKIVSKPVRVALLGAVVLGLMVATAVFAAEFTIDGRFRWGLLTHSYLFILGILAADIAGDALSRPREKSGFSDFVFLVGLFGFMAIGIYMTQIDARLSGSWPTLLLQLSTTFCLALVFVGAFYGKISSSFLSLPWIRLIGTMCYSVYLTHIVAMQAVGGVLGKILHTDNPALIWAAYFALLIPAGLVVGLIFYVCVERPFAAAASAKRGRKTPSPSSPIINS